MTKERSPCWNRHACARRHDASRETAPGGGAGVPALVGGHGVGVADGYIYDMNLCYKCFDPSPTLEATFKKRGRPGDCDVCQARRKRVLEASELQPLFRGLSGLYQVAEPGEHFYSVRDEGEDYGGGDTGAPLPQLLQDEWPVFADAMDHDVIESILSEVWPEYSGDLYAKEALWYRHPDDEWEAIKDHVKHERRFFQEDSGCDFTSLPSLLDPFIKRLTARYEGGTWIRARIQSAPDKPFALSQMGAPPRGCVAAGRANPPGISYLYLSSDELTACAEVRAEPGHGVTVAKFDISGPIKVLDVAAIMRGIDPFAHADLKAEIERSQLVRAFAEDLSRPVLAEDAPLDYVPTQYLAEFFAYRGFDGIRYRSSVAEGTNLVLFTLARAKAMSTKSLRVTAKHLTVVDAPKSK